MATNQLILNIVRFVLLLLAQVLIFNDLGFMGFVNPMVYVLFVYWFPIKSNRIVLLVSAFFMGLLLDIFSDSIALHTIAITTIAYIRPLLLRFCFGANYELQGFSLTNTTQLQRITLLALIVFIHHLIFFTFEILSFSHFLLILKKLFFVGLLSLVVSLLLNSLFSRQTE